VRTSAYMMLTGTLLTLLAACQDNLPKATEIERMRILGTRIEVVGDEQRSTPKPGEKVRVSLTTVFPSIEDSADDLHTLLIGCTAPGRYTGGIPICQELIDLATTKDAQLIAALPMLMKKLSCADIDPGILSLTPSTSLQCLTGAPTAVLPVGSDFRADNFLFLGVVCERGTPYVDATDPLLFGCEDNDGETIRVHGQIPVEYKKADENRNPNIDDALSLTIDDGEWDAFDPDMLPDENDCEQSTDQKSPTIPRRTGGDHTIGISYDPKDRDLVDGKPEVVELTVYATDGDMERRFTLFDELDTPKKGLLKSQLKWSPPLTRATPKAGELPIGGQKLVRFFITVRDQRSGYDVTSRAVCLH